jgi:hypothetical protein
MTPTAEERRSLQLLAESGQAIADGVARELARWVERQVTRILDAWGRADAPTRTRAEREAVGAGRAAAARVAAELHALFALDPADQRATPLEIVRSAYREPTAVLAAAGIPPVERSGFDERAWPDDAYGLVVHDLGDLGDPELAPLHFAWGMAKAGVLRSRADHTSDHQVTDP